MTNRLLDVIAAAIDRRKSPTREVARSEAGALADADTLSWVSEARGWHGKLPAEAVERPAVDAVHLVALIDLADGSTETVTVPTDPASAGADLGVLADWCNPARVAKREQLNRITDATIATLEAKVAEVMRRAERAEVVSEALADLYRAGDVRAAAAIVAERMLPEPPKPLPWDDPTANPMDDVRAHAAALHGENVVAKADPGKRGPA